MRAPQTSLVAFNVAGHDPMALANDLNRAGVESRAGCHCATLAHHALGLTPPASCRLSFYLYNTLDEVDRAVDALHAIVGGQAWSGRPRWGTRAKNTRTKDTSPPLDLAYPQVSWHALGRSGGVAW